MVNEADSALGAGWSTMPHARGGVRAEALTPAFERERDVFNARQLRDAGKTESERRAAFKARRREQSGSAMIRQQHPHPVLKPSHGLAHGADRLTADRREAYLAAKLATTKAVRGDPARHQDGPAAAQRESVAAPSELALEKANGLSREAFMQVREAQERSADPLNRSTADRRAFQDRSPDPNQ